MITSVMNINSRTASGIRTLEHTNLVSPLITNKITGYGPEVSLKNFSTGDFQDVSNRFGEIKINDVGSIPPPLSSNVSTGLLNVFLNFDPEKLFLDGQERLSVVPPSREPP